MTRAKTREEINSRRANSTPEAIGAKQRLGKAHGNERALVRLGKGNTNILTGQEDLSTWDDEELRRGRKRDANGQWRGVDPVVVPKALHDELVRRTLSAAEEAMRKNLVAAVEALCSIALNAQTEDKARVTAIKLVMDRVMGKEPQRVEVSSKAKWQIALEGGIVSLKDAIAPDDSDDDDTDES